jgi:hypothetical protein
LTIKDQQSDKITRFGVIAELMQDTPWWSRFVVALLLILGPILSAGVGGIYCAEHVQIPKVATK